MDVNKVKIVSVLILTLCTAACSFRTRAPADATPAEPLSIRVDEELNDGQRLRIAATVTAHVEWPSSDAELNLETMQGDQILEQRRLPLGALINSPSSMLIANQTYPVLLDMPAKDADNYQLSLLWGADVRGVQTAEFKIDKVERIQLECNPECKEKLNIIGELYNGGSKLISTVELRIEVFKMKEGDQALDLQARTPDNVQSLVVNGLTLAPSKKRKLKLVLDTPFTLGGNGGENRPVVKIIRVNE